MNAPQAGAEHLIAMSEFGECLTTRDLAKEACVKVLSLIHGGAKVVFDLSQTQIITPSFADELFGVLLTTLGKEEFKAKVGFSGANEQTKRLVNLVLNRRLQQLRSAA